ncbi:hypothetical protein AHAS_Ahas11G0127700 [Arachis hypogaea]
MDYDSNSWIWGGGGEYTTTHVLGGLMVTAALLGLSTSYFGGMTNSWSHLEIFPKKRSGKRHVRVYMDGCFDLMHYGHANALRQAKVLGDELVVGLVDEVITDAPYAITEEFLNRLFYEYNIDYVIHGDDCCLLPDGTDAYATAKKAGRYKQIKCIEGVSSTDIVGKIYLFLCSKIAEILCC